MTQQFRVPLLDLKGQYDSIAEEVRAAVEEVLESQQFILGPKVESLEAAVADYCDCGYAVGVSSGSDALLIALMTAEIGPGCGVITTPFTFFSTAGAVTRVGARPFFVDIDPVTFNLDPRKVQTFIETECRFSREQGLIHRQTGALVRAIIPVHLYGQCADMDPILAVAAEYGLLTIEDAAQAIGALYPSTETGAEKHAGTMGDYGCFSFFPTKNLGGFGDAGMVTTADSQLAETLRVLRVHGSKPKYYHQLIGGNFRLDALQAAVLLVKLRYLDAWVARRRQNAFYYDSLFQGSRLSHDGLVTPPHAVWESVSSRTSSKLETVTPGISSDKLTSDGRKSTSQRHVYNQYVIRAKNRDELRLYLAEQGIGTEIYYPLPLHRQECFASLDYKQGVFPESEKAAAETLALPIYPELQSAQLEYVVEKIKAFYAARA
ncbi:MAG: DegT/DnrJ/EryC1/StrS family aminotransferase [Deltaproteobacteria bacterium]|nr:MAG: DegT/DnrJ/EryC1/StrS family aminotransferase [Deltaproteobacteria bacterium]